MLSENRDKYYGHIFNRAIVKASVVAHATHIFTQSILWHIYTQAYIELHSLVLSVIQLS
mgnify:FL=1